MAPAATEKAKDLASKVASKRQSNKGESYMKPDDIKPTLHTTKDDFTSPSPIMSSIRKGDLNCASYYGSNYRWL
ncbi:hypothetical protein GH733_006659 [Mirounga leonina]|nr:hypothetical protein GH733_006659 [Mirounga leonina]